MSMEADTELRDMVTEYLNSIGVLAKIRAQLRASIFIALEEENRNLNKTPFINSTYREFIETAEGKLIFLLIREFLDYFNFECTASVLESECNMDSSCVYTGREQLVEELKFHGSLEHMNGPLILSILKLSQCTETQVNVTYTKPTVNNETDDKLSNLSANSDLKCNHSRSDISDISIANTPKPITEIRTTKKILDLGDQLQVSSPQSDSPIEVMSPLSECGTNSHSLREQFEKDDTFDGTSSIAEDSVKSPRSIPDDSFLVDIEMSTQKTEHHSKIRKKVERHILDETVPDMNYSLRQPERSEKAKSLSTLSSLHDLPPLTFNKNKVSDTILRPLTFAKDVENKSSPKDVGFEMESLDNYEEDFMSGSDVDYGCIKGAQTPSSSRSSCDNINKSNGNNIFDNKQPAEENIKYNNIKDTPVSVEDAKAVINLKNNTSIPTHDSKNACEDLHNTSAADIITQQKPLNILPDDLASKELQELMKGVPDDSSSISEDFNFDEESKSIFN